MRIIFFSPLVDVGVFGVVGAVVVLIGRGMLEIAHSGVKDMSSTAKKASMSVPLTASSIT